MQHTQTQQHHHERSRRRGGAGSGPEAFAGLGLHGAALAGAEAAGYVRPTPIQEQALPFVLQGRDVVGCAQTGTGKTAAFLLPTLQNLAEREGGSTARAADEAPVRERTNRSRHERGRHGDAARPRALVVTPTRELAAQIETVGRTLASRTGHGVLAVYGGVKYGPQARKVRAGVDLLVATPGRLLDMMNQGDVSLDEVGVLVLDEADRMLDMGFWPDIRRISAAVPAGRQSLFFSATMTREVLSVIESTLDDPVFLEVGGTATPVESIAQSVLPVAHAEKSRLLVDYLRHHEPECTLVFARTRRRADRVAKMLNREGVPCAAIHGSRSQSQREKALSGFRRRRIKVLVATDIVARGIDVDGITHVINFDVPVSAEDYVHRIGRTARAGSSGKAVTLFTRDESDELKAIERLIGARLERRDLHGTVTSRRTHKVHKGGSRGSGRGTATEYAGVARRQDAVVVTTGLQGENMATGTVKWFNANKGYGFIAREGEKDVFVHINELAPGVGTLDEEQAVEFEVQEGDKGLQAVNVRPV